ncbi:hypothetical protein CLV24_12614 [Pontibacter ummariensis]|uniref:Uncharacterized protein n=1 Tax=Pontibacter ummariensis TaxID=1610492 RepID=A0A239K4L5_9BACT|nr:hypothetical protein [Pontibacter ummariensis]PRY06748.1 hypothetical protein CLV24_12614 [Pontibacter ummariensis]SNT13366.1 hypothetical protein SAMN06296052_12639 [Pontibacter ummariensis]
MKKYAYTVFLLLLFAQCQQEGNPRVFQSREEQVVVTDGVKFGQEFSLAYYEETTVYGNQVPRRLNLYVKYLNDSRCPANAMCMQYGNATVVLSASNSQGKSEHIELCIGACGTEPIRSTYSVTAAVGQTKYTFTLKEVRPFPGMEQEGEVKKAVLVVEKV